MYLDNNESLLHWTERQYVPFAGQSNCSFACFIGDVGNKKNTFQQPCPFKWNYFRNNNNEKKRFLNMIRLEKCDTIPWESEVPHYCFVFKPGWKGHCLTYISPTTVCTSKAPQLNQSESSCCAPQHTLKVNLSTPKNKVSTERLHTQPQERGLWLLVSPAWRRGDAQFK